MLSLLILETANTTRIIVKETIPLTFYIPVIVSILTATAAAYATIRNTRVTTKTQREMANLADRTAKEFKEKDYKNDFYKKIIDKRLSTWEHAERFLELIGISRQSTDYKETIYNYFLSAEELGKVQQALVALNARSFWMNRNYIDALRAFENKLNEVAEECILFEEGEMTGVNFAKIDNQKLVRAGVKYYEEFKVLTRNLIRSQSAMLVTLHDIESFLAEKV